MRSAASSRRSAGGVSGIDVDVREEGAHRYVRLHSRLLSIIGARIEYVGRAVTLGGCRCEHDVQCAALCTGP